MKINAINTSNKLKLVKYLKEELNLTLRAAKDATEGKLNVNLTPDQKDYILKLNPDIELIDLSKNKSPIFNINLDLDLENTLRMLDHDDLIELILNARECPNNINKMIVFLLTNHVKKILNASGIK